MGRIAPYATQIASRQAHKYAGDTHIG
ncbi:uncharacterized protein METZ01_LOCUS333600 [marine metagenome]|uniref:Uncharacterized protein n=1 Tax=marine metagenome TaxID=408172 RepID=A0A382Q5Q6_9ZZZZ